MGLTFHKMQGAGNDFVLLDLRPDLYPTLSEKIRPQGHDPAQDPNPDWVRRVADRRLGVGFDQLLVLRQPRSADAAARYEIWNTDGTRARQCGNGARCIALYLKMTGAIGDDAFTLESPSGPVSIERKSDGQFEVDMGAPRFEPARIPITLAPEAGRYRVDIDGDRLEFGAVSMGNPHCTLVVDDLSQAPVATLGPRLGSHEIFPEGCNVGFAQVVNRGEILLRVFERGAGETRACGSGACAAAVVLRRDGLIDETVRVVLPGGCLVIKWPGSATVTDSGHQPQIRQSTGNVFMSGPAEYVFRGEWNE